MAQILHASSADLKTTLTELLSKKGPLLVEVRFPAMATSPDWHLCEEETEVESILDGLGPGAELHLHSVWDLTNSRGPLVLKK